MTENDMIKERQNYKREKVNWRHAFSFRRFISFPAQFEDEPMKEGEREKRNKRFRRVHSFLFMVYGLLGNRIGVDLLKNQAFALKKVMLVFANQPFSCIRGVRSF